jgi:2,4-dienoyl-CoA reductase-like NADH-dependent reductase (Old Yellow Enzyme family)/thioredoxin reductase
MNRQTRHRYVFQPIKIGNVILKNRIMSPPMMSGCATFDGTITPELIAFTRGVAKSGPGLVVIGDTSIDRDRSFDHLHGTNIGSDFDVPRYRLLVEEIRRYGAKASIEINHPGAFAYPPLLGGKPALSPSPLPAYMHPDFKGNPIKVMDKDDIKQVIQNFVDAVGRCITAGFDMVMIHGAHGWLLGQFMSPSFNQRTDEYGGSLENRIRFPLELIKAIRETHGDKIGIDMRVSGSSRVPKEITGGEMEIDDMIIFLKEAQKYVDSVNFSAGFAPFPLSLEYMIPSYFHPHMLNAEFAAKAKKVLDIPVSAVGSFVTVDQADAFIAEGKCDVVGMGRAGLADGYTFVKAAQGRDDEIRPCLRCSLCADRMAPPYFRPIRCAVNPLIGRELEYPSIPVVKVKKKVMIIGGGPAGMAAAQLCIQRGHEVVLYEKADKLGGMLHIASALPFKYDMRRYTEWMVRTTMNCGAKIVLNTEATPEIIKNENPDVLLVAIGSVPAKPSIPGIDDKNVLWAGDVDSGRVKTGQKVIVAGAGLTGAECALALGEEGKNVTLVDMIPPEDFLKDASGMVKLALMARYHALNIPVMFNSVITEMTENGLKYKDKVNVGHELTGDTIVNALGMCVDQKKLENILSVVSESYEIGDCSGKSMNIMSAVLDGFSYGMEI